MSDTSISDFVEAAELEMLPGQSPISTSARREKKKGKERRGEKTGWKNVKEDRHRNSDENIAKQISIQVLWKTSDFVVDFD